MLLPHHPELVDRLRAPTRDDPWRVLLSGCLASWSCGLNGTDYGLGAGGPGELADRVVRGGAGTMGQNPGEWQALLTAFRQRAGGLLYSIGVRAVRSVG